MIVRRLVVLAIVCSFFMTMISVTTDVQGVQVGLSSTTFLGDGLTSKNPQIAVDNNGNAVAVWEEWAVGSEHWSIYSARYTAGAWGTAKLIDNGANPAHNPEVAMDSKGNAIAVWEQFDGAYFSIYSARYTAGAWGTAKLIETATGDALDSQIAMDGNGNAMAVWKQTDGAYFSIYSARYTAGAWGTPKIIDTGVGDSYYPQIAMDDHGDAVAVWMHFGLPTDNNIYVNRYTGGAWGTPKAIKTGTGTVYDPQIAMDGKGTAIAVWQQFDGAYFSIYSSRYSAGVWGKARMIETTTGDAATPRIAMDDNGNAVAVWQQFDGTHFSIYSNRCSAGVWAKARLIETGPGDSSDPQIAMDSKGNAEVVWVQTDGSGQNCIFANRCSAGAWGTANVIETFNGDASIPQVAMNDNGKAVVVWRQGGASAYAIYATSITLMHLR
jgi:phage terminase large subunit-like protein